MIKGIYLGDVFRCIKEATVTYNKNPEPGFREVTYTIPVGETNSIRAIAGPEWDGRQYQLSGGYWWTKTELFEHFELIEISERSAQESEKITTPPYYDNTKGSLYKVATDRGWNFYLSDVVKRLERGGKKDPLKQEIEKSIAVLQLWLTEIEP
jgi:hypothetical protein